MRKILLLFISFLLLLSGCGNQPANTITKPHQIKVNSEILSLYDNPAKFEENYFEIFQYDDYPSDHSPVDSIIINQHHIYSISIVDETIITYKSISVGDDIDKVKDSFVYGQTLGSESYMVTFNNKNEEVDIDISNEKSYEGTYSILYEYYDGKIDRIFIYRHE